MATSHSGPGKGPSHCGPGKGPAASCPKSQSKRDGLLVCPNCFDVIIDPVGKKKGQPSIQCNGPCHMWLHRQCAGLSKAAFDAAGASSDPFFCSQCIIASQHQEISTLKSKLEEVICEISHLKSEIADLKGNLTDPSPDTDNDTDAPTHPVNTPQSTVVSQRQYDKKFNLVFHGIPECPPGTPFSTRFDRDHNSVISAIGSDDSVSTIRDCMRLGKYRNSNSRPRPVLVKFNNMKSVNSVLLRSNSSSNHGISIKRDLSLQERKTNSLLLKERYRLSTEENVAKHQIKFRGNKLLIGNRPHGEVQGNDFVTFPSLGEVAPSLVNLSNTTSNTPSISPLSPRQSGVDVAASVVPTSISPSSPNQSGDSSDNS